MPGMEIAVARGDNFPGDYDGFSTNYSGAGFSKMRFRFHSTDVGFDKWVANVRGDGGTLGRERYLTLAAPSEDVAPMHFREVDPDLFRRVVNRCVEEGRMCTDEMSALDARGGTGLAGTLNTRPAEAGRRAPSASRRSTSAPSARPPSRSQSTGRTPSSCSPRRPPRAGPTKPSERGTTPMATEHHIETSFLFGRLTLAALPLHEPILVATFAAVALGGIALIAALTYFRLWGYLWHEWFTSVDHKRIGVMYVVLGIIMLLRGFADAVMMRLQQSMAFNGSEGYLPAHHYDQIFTAHGVIMIFFVAMPLVTGLMNFVMPLQIGARDVAFPFLNNFSFWMTVGGAAITMASLFVGEFAQTGWLAYPPLSGFDNSPGVGVDYYIWGLRWPESARPCRAST